MAQPGTTSRIGLAVLWLLTGAVMVAVTVWFGLTRWQVVLSGHPALLVLAIATGVAGLFAVVWGVASAVAGVRGDGPGATGDGPPAPPDRAARRRAATWRLAVGVPLVALCLLLAATLAWLRPFPAEPSALAAMRSSGTVRVVDRLTWYEMQPARRTAAGAVPKPTTGLVFSPGARVDPRAYAKVLRPLAEAGFVVVVLKEPLNLALLAPDHALAPMGLYPDVRYWAVGGHSLGGVPAAALAGREPTITGLLLYGAYTPTAITRTDLRVTSISGDADGHATPADIADGRPNLPPKTRYVVIKGGIHSYFGDYGLQPGDGQPRVGRAAAQATIVAESKALLTGLRPAPRRR